MIKKCAARKTMANRVNKLREILNIILPDFVSFEVEYFDSEIPAYAFETLKAEYPLSNIEYGDIQKAVPKREAEYRIGRFLAKKLLGLNRHDTTTSLYKKPNGAVHWPEGVIGTISHSGNTCIVALTNNTQYAGMGIDIEYGEFDSDLEKLIVKSDELSLNTGALTYTAGLRLIFCCKEAIYKSLEIYLSERLDFLDVTIQFLKPIDSNIFEFGFQFSRKIRSLKTFDNKLFYGLVYANEEMALAAALLKHNCRFAD